MNRRWIWRAATHTFVRYGAQTNAILSSFDSDNNVLFVVPRSIRQTVAMNRELTLNSIECWFLMPLAKSIDGVKVS